MEKGTTCCFTGHRRLTLEQTCHAYDGTVKIIKTLARRGYVNFCCGGALGYDTIAAQAVLELKGRLNIRLVLILPCVNQTEGWSDANKILYGNIKQKADEVIYIGESYVRGCMHKRNRALVDSSSVCVCYNTNSAGGTAYTVDYAKKHGLEIINVAK